MYYPPPWGYPPQLTNTTIDAQTLEKGIRLAEKLRQRETREKERQENRKKRDYDDNRKRAAAARARMFTSLEWFIIGVVSYPIVGPLYNFAINYTIHAVAK